MTNNMKIIEGFEGTGVARAFSEAVISRHSAGLGMVTEKPKNTAPKALTI